MIFAKTTNNKANDDNQHNTPTTFMPTQTIRISGRCPFEKTKLGDENKQWHKSRPNRATHTVNSAWNHQPRAGSPLFIYIVNNRFLELANVTQRTESAFSSNTHWIVAEQNPADYPRITRRVPRVSPSLPPHPAQQAAAPVIFGQTHQRFKGEWGFDWTCW